jgi:hypothetical protein
MSFLDTVIEQVQDSETAECMAFGNLAAAQVTAMRMDLGANWNPTGYYSPDQIEQIHQKIKAMADAALSALDKGLALVNKMPSSEYPALLRNERGQLVKAMTDGDRFLVGARRVREHGSGVVDAPDFKQWVLHALGRVDNSVTGTAMIACQQPWWAGLYSGFSKLVSLAWGAIKTVAGVVVSVGEFVASVPATFGGLARFLKWALIIGVSGVAIYAGLQLYRKHFAHGGLLPKLPEAWQLPD